MKKISLLILAAAFLAFSTMGCNMAKGGGEDVEKAGKNIQKSADKNS